MWLKRHKCGHPINLLVISVNVGRYGATSDVMVDARKFSRQRHRIKLARSETLERRLRVMLYAAMREHDPTAVPGAVAVIAKLSATLASQLMSETQANQRSLKTLRSEASEIGVNLAYQVRDEARKDVRSSIKKTKATPPATEGGISLADDWAGPVAGPTLIERHFGIPRSTLYRWQKRGEVIWLNTRTSRKPVFPLRQFVDGRPVDGIREVSEAMSDPKSAWQWLISPHSAFDGAAPLDLLLGGNSFDVIEAARQAGPYPVLTDQQGTAK